MILLNSASVSATTLTVTRGSLLSSSSRTMFCKDIGASHFLNAHTREFRRRDVFANVDESGASETDLLKSMPSREVSNMFLQCPEDWGLRSTMTREGAAAYVCWKVLEDQRLYKACFNRQQDDSIASYSIERMIRRETTNWVMSSQRKRRRKAGQA